MKKKKILEINNVKDILAYPSDWPPQEYQTDHRSADLLVLEEMVKLIDSNASETKLDSFITKNPSILSYLIGVYNTGHQGTWVIPKKTIKTKIQKTDRGQIPDFLVAGKSSDGIEWFVVELKGANTNIFSETNGRYFFSPEMNKGINQLFQYLHICDEDQAYFRDRHKLSNFRNPRAILLIGRSSEFNENKEKQTLKSNWNKTLQRIRITTYDSLRAYLVEKIKIINSSKSV